MTQQLDILAFGAHPDDVEVGAGGLLYKWTQEGKHVGIFDLSQGESSTNGTVDERRREAESGAIILGVKKRGHLGMPCGFIQTNEASIMRVINLIRRYRPAVVLAPYWQDRHSDHVETSNIVSRAVFRSSMPKVNTGQAAHKVDRLFYYMLHYDFKPSFVVDISKEFFHKMRAIKAHDSQFNGSNMTHPTHINQGNFLDFVEARSKYFGFKAGIQYGEPYAVAEDIIGVYDPLQILTKHI